MGRVKGLGRVLLLVFMMLFIWVGFGSLSRLEASSGISVWVNDTFLSFDQPPLIVNGTTLLPFRSILEALGAQVQWEQATGSVVATRGATRLVLNTRDNIASVNEEKVLLDVSARIVNGRTMVPVRFMAEALGAQVSFDEEEKTVQINLARVGGIVLDKENLELTTGETATLTATVLPEKAANKNITWHSTDSSVATVHKASSTEAVVTPRAGGSAVIIATTEEGGYVSTCQVVVKARQVPVSGISLNRSSLHLVAGESPVIIAARVTPAHATNKKVNWASSNSSVAIVGSTSVTDGVVTPLAEGRTVVTAKTEDGGFVATCNVTVEAYATPVKGISLSRDTLNLEAGGEPQILTAYLHPAHASNQTVTWRSSDTRVVTVSRYAADPSDGITEASLLPLQEGTATVTVTTEDGDFVATCIVRVR